MAIKPLKPKGDLQRNSALRHCPIPPCANTSSVWRKRFNALNLYKQLSNVRLTTAFDSEDKTMNRVPIPPLREVLAGISVIFGMAITAASQNAQAVPSFARQTGTPCTACHTMAFGPNLTPYGREFKLNGYVWGKSIGDEGYVPPLSAMVVGSFTNTARDQDTPPGPVNRQGVNIQHFNTNNNFAFNEASLFYAGKIWGKVGAFSQLTYSGIDDVLSLDNTDVRFADQIDLLGQDVVYGITANNNPTVQDLWNTTPAWGFPFVSSDIAPTPDPAAMLDGGVSGLETGQIGGMTAYAMVNRLLYVEAGAYASFSNNFMIGTGNFNNWGNPPLNRIDGGAPYWRIALEKDWNGHYVELGHYGMSANVFPLSNKTGGTDNYTDLAFDATYQYLANPQHIAEFKTTYIRENRDLTASANLGNVLNRSNYVDTFKINGSYTYAQTYTLILGYNKTWARTDAFMDAESGDVVSSGNNGHEYFTAELSYVPFGKTYTPLTSLLNLKLGLQYIGYTQFDGVQNRSNSNNTFLAFGWLAF
jgi:hypothetical protein